MKNQYSLFTIEGKNYLRGNNLYFEKLSERSKDELFKLMKKHVRPLHEILNNYDERNITNSYLLGKEENEHYCTLLVNALFNYYKLSLNMFQIIHVKEKLPFLTHTEKDYVEALILEKMGFEDKLTDLKEALHFSIQLLGFEIPSNTTKTFRKNKR